MPEKTVTFPLIRTKFQRPRLPEDLISRPGLVEQLHGGLDRKLTLISAQAGAGKSTLLAQWLAGAEHIKPSAWLSLDENDNDLIVFLGYLCGAIRTVFPAACGEALDLLRAAQTPPARAITAALVNEMNSLVQTGGRASNGGSSSSGLILALDDYQNITEPEIHEMISSLIRYLPQGVHLALASRRDPPLKLADLRARNEMTELRSADLRLSRGETQRFLEATVGRALSSETIALMKEKTEGWVVGLRLAALSLRHQPDVEAFAVRFGESSSANIIDYLMSEVVSQQPPAIQDFMLRTSVLDRFSAPLCEAVSGVSEAESREIIERLERDNLFLVPLDLEGRWYRYHHLLRDLLRLRLEHQHSAGEVSSLHTRAGTCFARNGWIDEALHHLLAANDISAATDLVARHRYALMNQTQWQRLDRYLRRFSPDILDRYPDLLMLKTWLLYHRGQYAQLPAALGRVEAALAGTSLTPEAVDHLRGEMNALRSLLSYFAGDAQGAMGQARGSIETIPPALWIVRILARMNLAGALQMRGALNDAYAAIYGALEEEVQSNPFKATLLATVCNIYWMAADLQGLAQAASQCLAFSRDPRLPQMMSWGHYHLGRVRYHQNDLITAKGHFTAVVEQPYLNYGVCHAYSACALALIHQVQGRPDEARKVLEAASAFKLETGNTTLLPVVQAFQAELALMQGQVATASQWANRLDPVPPLTPIYGFFSPHLTLVKVWLAQNTVASRQNAADLLDRAKEFLESTHNTRFLIEVLALHALLYDVEGDEPAALDALERAITLAEPSRFIRLFVDLGPPMARLLDRLRWRGVAAEYITQILAAYETTDDERRTTELSPSSVVLGASPLVEPLTPRELEVLELLDRHMTNKEIAEELIVSPATVKTHTLHIYGKLDVRTRRQAVTRARELGIL